MEQIEIPRTAKIWWVNSLLAQNLKFYRYSLSIWLLLQAPCQIFSKAKITELPVLGINSKVKVSYKLWLKWCIHSLTLVGKKSQRQFKDREILTNVQRMCRWIIFFTASCKKKILVKISSYFMIEEKQAG